MLATLAMTALLAQAPAQQPERVYLGIYLSDVSALDLKEGHFEADLEVWVKWLGGEAPPAFTFVNGQVGELDELAREADGSWRSVRYRTQGTFRGRFPLQHFPFDTQTLAVEVALARGGVELLPDLAGSGMGETFSISGWSYEPYFSARSRVNEVASDLGSISHEGRPSRVPVLSFEVQMRRPLVSYVLKFMLPLAIIIMMAVLSFFLSPDVLDVRMGMVVTSLLSCVAFHFAMADSLPDVSYLVTADKLFLGSYIIIIAAVAATVVSHNLAKRGSAGGARLDSLFRAVAPALTGLGAVLSVAVAQLGPDAPPVPERALAATPATARSELRVGVHPLNSLYAAGFTRLLRRGLAHVDEKGRRVPFLAAELPSMTNESVRFLNDGGMRVRWRLRPELRWSDGRPISSEDLAFSLSLVENPDRLEVTTLDGWTLEVRYRNRLPAHLEEFNLFPRAHAEPAFRDGGYSAVTARVGREPYPGDGPYVLERFEAGKQAVFRRNPHFAGPAPALERIVATAYPSAEEAAAALLRGEVDYVPQTSSAAVAALRPHPDKARVDAQPAEDTYVLAFDLEHPPFDRLEVRRALAHALDREKLARSWFGDDGRPARSYRPPSAEHPVEAAKYPYDPARARALLAEAGVATPLELRLIWPEAAPGSAQDLAMREVLRDLEAVGVTAEPVSSRRVPRPEQLARRHRGLLFVSFRATDDLARLWGVPFVEGRHVVKPGKVFDGEVLAEYQRLRQSMFAERREVISRRLEQLFAERLPSLPLAHTMKQSARVSDLEGMAVGPLNPPWWDVERWHFVTPSERSPGSVEAAP